MSRATVPRATVPRAHVPRATCDVPRATCHVRRPTSDVRPAQGNYVTLTPATGVYLGSGFPAASAGFLGSFNWNASCDPWVMTITDPRDLRCWQLADAVRREVNALCKQPRLVNDFRFCDGFRDAAGSVCRNIAEGFARYESPSIVQFFRYALASLVEVQDYLNEASTRGALDEPALVHLLTAASTRRHRPSSS